MYTCRSDLVCEIALTAVQRVAIDKGGGRKEIDIKRYARVEMIPGGTIEDSEVLCGVMLNKDVTHPRMKRYSSLFGEVLCVIVYGYTRQMGFSVKIWFDDLYHNTKTRAL